VLSRPRRIEIHRKTKETDIHLILNPDGSGRSSIHTGIGFFDHMLEQVARHGGMDLKIECKGDLHIDAHHTVEDTGIALGEALRAAAGDKRGLARYGSSALGRKNEAISLLLPMDESLVSCALDFSGRAHFVFQGKFRREKVGDLPVDLVKHFFEAVVQNAGINLHLILRGENDHHQVEAAFKAFARSLRQALARSGHELPSTKGIL
jgi:imidazoleglycerol-phosphate dehydratase/histidinol-phosphatase